MNRSILSATGVASGPTTGTNAAATPMENAVQDGPPAFGSNLSSGHHAPPSPGGHGSSPAFTATTPTGDPGYTYGLPKDSLYRDPNDTTDDNSWTEPGSGF